MQRLINYSRMIRWLAPINEKETDYENIEKAKDNLWFSIAIRGRAVVGEIEWQKREWRDLNSLKEGMLYIVYANGVYVGRAKAMKMYKNKEAIKVPSIIGTYITINK